MVKIQQVEDSWPVSFIQKFRRGRQTRVAWMEWENELALAVNISTTVRDTSMMT